MTDNTTNHTTAEGLRRDHDAFSGDWDSHGVTTVFLLSAIADALLTAHGWIRGHWRGGTGPWITPTGERVWETGDAVALALVVEALTDSDSNSAVHQPRSPER